MTRQPTDREVLQAHAVVAERLVTEMAAKRDQLFLAYERDVPVGVLQRNEDQQETAYRFMLAQVTADAAGKMLDNLYVALAES